MALHCLDCLSRMVHTLSIKISNVSCLRSLLYFLCFSDRHDDDADTVFLFGGGVL